MRTLIGCTVSLLALAVASPALAQDTAPPEAIVINGTATVVTDYRFRGISQTNKNFAVQGSLTATHESGFYVSAWGSSIDDYVANGSNQEIDLIGGFKKTIQGTTLDVGVLYYFYPASQKGGASFAGEKKYNSDFAEPYVSVAHTFGPVTAKATANYAFKQKALGLVANANGTQRRDDNLYTAFDLSGGIAPGVGLSAHIGHNWTSSALSLGLKKYTDWGAGVNYTYKAITFGVSYVGTDIPTAPLGKDVGKDGVVGSIGVSF
ncbi:TorF family putative porin [Sphingomonas sp.]|uniref:TorF family putative porin n=1 Tax=Sphingomonas sp. TaxID=28214 RepID=UPI0025E9F5D6|nr:TorF family putative porin [Sphingomonas sp.]